MIGVLALALASDPRPDDNNVVAGWVGAAVFVGLILAVAFILRSFTKHMKKVEAADKAGVYESRVQEPESSELPPTHHQA
jgi:hypothetical protein